MPYSNNINPSSYYKRQGYMAIIMPRHYCTGVIVPRQGCWPMPSTTSTTPTPYSVPHAPGSNHSYGVPYPVLIVSAKWQRTRHGSREPITTQHSTTYSIQYVRPIGRMVIVYGLMPGHLYNGGCNHANLNPNTMLS